MGCMQRVADAPEAVGLLRYLLIEDAPWPQRLQWVREYGLKPRMAMETVHHSKVDEFNRLFAEHGSASPVGVPMVYGNVCTRCLPGPVGRCVCGSRQRKRNRKRIASHRIASHRIACLPSERSLSNCSAQRGGMRREGGDSEAAELASLFGWSLVWWQCSMRSSQS